MNFFFLLLQLLTYRLVEELMSSQNSSESTTSELSIADGKPTFSESLCTLAPILQSGTEAVATAFADRCKTGTLTNEQMNWEAADEYSNCFVDAVLLPTLRVASPFSVGISCKVRVLFVGLLVVLALRVEAVVAAETG